MQTEPLKTQFFLNEINYLPKSINNQTTIEYFKLYQMNKLEYRELLINHNLRLVVHILNRYAQSKEDAEDFFVAGSIGLIKAVDTFRLDKNVKFATYASRCINTEILMVMRKNKKHRNVVSLQTVLCTDKDGNDLLLEDTLSSLFDLEEHCVEKEILKEIALLLKTLPQRDRSIILMRYFCGEEGFTQKEVGTYLNLDQSYICRLENEILSRLKMQLIIQKKPRALELQKKYKAKQEG